MWIAVFLVGIVLLLCVGRLLLQKDGSNAAKLMNTYRFMTKELLDGTPDDELIKAVVANLLAKAEDARRDAYAVIPTLAQERCAVYSVWLFQNELASEDASVLRQSGHFGFSELAADGLDLLNFPELAATLRDYLQTADDALAASMTATVKATDLDGALVAFIRDHADAFCDG